jgi:hypothetical protein
MCLGLWNGFSTLKTGSTQAFGPAVENIRVRAASDDHFLSNKDLYMQQNSPIDPIRINYFDIIENVDKWASVLFFIGAALSVASPLISETSQPKLFAWIQIAFLAAVLGLFILDIVVKLRLSPRAADARAQDFLSHAYGQDLLAARTAGYYNNNAQLGMQKIAAQTFENTLFTQEISRVMFNRQIRLGVIYGLIFLVGIAYRGTPITLWCAAAQVLFGEQIFLRFIRLWWLRRRAEQIHEDLRRLYISRSTGAQFDSIAMDAYTRYEMSKSTAGITLSSKIYSELNPRLTAEWDQLRARYAIP